MPFSLKILKICFLISFISYDVLAQFSPYTPNGSPDIITNANETRDVIWIDSNRDGLPDASSIHELAEHNLFINQGGAIFNNPILIPARLAVAAAGVGDFDGDAFLDFVVVSNNGSQFYVNNSGSFNLSENILTNIGSPSDVAVLDFNMDGKLDVIVATEALSQHSLYRNANTALGQVNQFPRETLGVNTESLGMSWTDFNNDLYPDLFFPTISGANQLFQNNGDGSFTQVLDAGDLLTTSLGRSFTAAWGDFNNDHFLDVFVGNEGNNALYQNNGDGTFTKVSQPTDHLEIGNVGTRNTSAAIWFDYDNDRFIDLFVVNEGAGGESYLYRNENGTGNFTLVENGGGAEINYTTDQDFAGIALADFNQDNFVDIYVGLGENSTLSNLLFQNDGNTNNGLAVSLSGTPSNNNNTSGIGARVRVRTGDTWQTRIISSHSGYKSRQFNVAYFGLGTATVADEIIVEWPSGVIQRDFNRGGIVAFADELSPPDLALSTPIPIPGGNVKQGISDHLLYQFQLSPSTTLGTRLNSLSFNTNGTFLASDIENNGFSLWVSTNNDFNTATRLDSAMAVDNGQDILFENLDLAIFPDETTYFWLTVDIDQDAVPGRRISIDPLTAGNFDFAIGSASPGVVLPGGLQIIEEAPPVTARTINVPNGLVDIGKQDHVVYRLELDVNNSDVIFEGIVFSLTGTYTLADIAPNGFQLWYNNTDDFASASLLSSQEAVLANTRFRFDGFNQPLSTSEEAFLWFTVDIDGGAQNGRTIQVNAPALSDFIFDAARVSGTLSLGGIQVITDPPELVASVIPVPDRNINLGVADQIIYQFQIDATRPATTLEAVSVNTAGTYELGDIQNLGFRLWINPSQNDFGGANSFSTINPVASGGILNFEGFRSTLRTDGTTYVWITASIDAGAQVGRNIRIAEINPSTAFDFTTGTATGTLPQGGLQTFSPIIPEITISSPNVPAGNVDPGTTGHLLYQVQINTSLANTTLNSVSFNTTGTYQASDIEIDGFRLLYNTTNDFSSASEVGIAAQGNAGQVLNFTGLNQAITITNPGFLWLTANLSANARAGNTLQILAPSLDNFTFSEGNKNGNPENGGIQTISPPTININSIPVAEGNVDPGTRNHILYQGQMDVSVAIAQLNQIRFPTAGSYQTNDLEANSFKLWSSTTNDFSTADSISSSIIVASGETITFANLNRVINQNSSLFFWVTADVALEAFAGRTVSILAPNDFTFLVGTPTTNVVNGGVQTISLPTINITSIPVAAGNVDPGTQNYILYQGQIDVSIANAQLERVDVRTAGSYLNNDLTGEAFKLWQASINDFSTALQIGNPIAVGSGEVLTFDDLNQMVGRNSSLFFWITVDVAPNAQSGNTLQITTPNPNDFTFNQGIPNGILANGSVHTISLPTINIRSIPVVAGNVDPGTQNYILYQGQIDVSIANTNLEQITFRTAGSYLNNDLAGEAFKLWQANTNDFNTALQIGNPSAVGSGEVLTFDDLNQMVSRNSSLFFWITVDIAPNAQSGNTLQITTPNPNDFTFNQGSPTGTLANGSVHTISLPTINIRSIPVAAGNVDPGTQNYLLYQGQIDVSIANTNLEQITFRTAGSYQNSDLAPNAFQLWQANTNDFNTALQIGNPIAVGSGAGITFDNLNQEIRRDSSLFFWISVDIAPNAQSGNTLQITVPNPNNVSFSSGNPTSALVNGNIQTISSPNITIRSLPIAENNVDPGTQNHILYQGQIDITVADAQLNAVNLPTTGTFLEMDLAARGFQFWQSTRNDFNTAGQIGNAILVNSGENLIFDNLRQSIKRDSSLFFWITVDINADALAGNTLQINTPSPNGFTFSFGTSSGTLTTGSVQTISSPNISIRSLAVPEGDVDPGTSAHILYQGQIDIRVANTQLNQVNLQSTGSYQASDLATNGFRLWQATINDFRSARPIGNAVSANSGDRITFDNLEQMIPSGSSLFFWITVDISVTATAGNTLQIDTPILDDFRFVSGSPIGTLEMGSVQTISSTEAFIINLSSIDVEDRNVRRNDQNEIIYQFQIDVGAQNNSILNDLALSLQGTYRVEDIVENTFTIWFHEENDFSAAEEIQKTSIQASGQLIRFEDLNISIQNGRSYFIWFTLDISPTATLGHTIQVQAIDLENINVSNGFLQGNLNEEATLRIIREEVINDVFIPTLFTPNNDQVNDLFRIRGTNIKQINLKIFDRNGTMVFQTNDVSIARDQGWTGDQQPSGAYTWVARIIFDNDEQSVQKGKIKLVR